MKESDADSFLTKKKKSQMTKKKQEWVPIRVRISFFTRDTKDHVPKKGGVRGFRPGNLFTLC